MALALVTVARTTFAGDLLDDLITAWRETAAQAESEQPTWSSPLITTSGLLEQRVRFDASYQRVGNGSSTAVLDGGKGIDLIVGPDSEVQIGGAPYDFHQSSASSGSYQGFADWPFLRVKERIASAPESGGDYFVTAWLQVQAPTGIPQLSSRAWTLTPTLAVGKGWGAFDVQATAAGVLPTSRTTAIGDQVQTSIALQYHVRPVFWPELETTWTRFVGGPRSGVDQVFLTPGLVVGRVVWSSGLSFTTGVGYQIAVAPAYRPTPLVPAYSNAVVLTSRLNF